MFSPLGLYHEKLPGSKTSNRETFKRELLKAVSPTSICANLLYALSHDLVPVSLPS
jgi:hypothetical protein